jgi:hypothetical protein
MERIYGPLVFSTGTLNIDRYGKALMGRTVAIQINYSQALAVSAVNLFFSNDGVNWLNYTSDITVKQLPAGGAERTTGICFQGSGYDHFRLQLVHSSGSPTIEVLIGSVA